MASDVTPLAEERGHASWLQGEIDREIQSARDVRGEAGDKSAARASKQSLKRAEELHSIRDEILIGRLDTLSEEVIYIGKTVVFGDMDDDMPLVVNWRAPLGAVFNQASRDDPMDIGRRRSISMRSRKVTQVSEDQLVPGFVVSAPSIAVPAPPIPVPPFSADEGAVPTLVDPTSIAVSSDLGRNLDEAPDGAPSSPTEQVNPDEDLRAADILLEELNAERSGAMHEIVATIQADQDRLIRSNPDEALVIQGGPGTGKTVVALHRAAWVLFQQRESGGVPSVLVVGPNDAFIDYIRDVLPSLGESTVQHHSLDTLCRSGIPTKDERSSTRPRRREFDDEALLKGDIRMATVVDSAVWAEASPTQFELGFDRFILRVDVGTVERILAVLREHRIAYDAARRELVDRLCMVLVQQLGERVGGGGVSQYDIDRLEAAARAQIRGDDWLKEVMPRITARQVVLRLFSDVDWARQHGSVLTDSEVSLLTTYAGQRYRWCRSDGPLLAEAAMVLRGAPISYDHVVVDEAQDLSPMMWRVVSVRCGSGVTITGDLAQATTVWGPATWDEVADRAGLGESPAFGQLGLGYRVPEPVMLYAGRLLPSASPTTELPRSFRRGEAPEVRWVKYQKDLLESVLDSARALTLLQGSTAVVCTASAEGRIRKAIEAEQLDVAVVADEVVKGLEFDHVVVAEPSDIADHADQGRGLRNLYICLTRCTKRLTVVHNKPLPAVLALPLLDGSGVREAIQTQRFRHLKDEVGQRAAMIAVHPRSYQKWSVDEDEELLRRLAGGLTIEEVAALHKRAPSSIRGRMKKLDLT